MIDPQPLTRHLFDAAGLMADYPPRIHHAGKQAVFGIACAPGSRPQGEIVVTRWAEMALPAAVDLTAGVTGDGIRPGYFDYQSSPAGVSPLRWTLNFADAHLFFAYGGPLFAQDEMQVAEHPALASVREALIALNVPALTVEAARPTPVLVRGVERRCIVDTRPDRAAGRPHGLYGNHFARASLDAVRGATRAVEPPTLSNILAIAAPGYGIGAYSQEEIRLILATAHTGFRAAWLETAAAGKGLGTTERPRVAIHTGYWGCGAFGGNRVLMALLQLLAARLAQVDELVFHSGGDDAPYEEAVTILQQLTAAAQPVPVAPLLAEITAMGFRWGVSDGN